MTEATIQSADDPQPVPGAKIDRTAGLTPTQLVRFLQLLEAGRQPSSELVTQHLQAKYDFPRGWNASVDHMLRTLERAQAEP